MYDREDGLFRLTARLAYEIYGNVTNFLELRRRGLRSLEAFQQIQDINRVIAFNASIEFLDKLLRSGLFESDAKLIRKIRDEEKTGLDYWMTRICRDALEWDGLKH